MAREVVYKIHQRMHPEDEVRIKGPGESKWRPYPVTMAQAQDCAHAHGVPLVPADQQEGEHRG